MRTVLPAVVFTIALSGCMTEATQERFTQEGANSQACKLKMVDARVQIAKWKAEEAKNNKMSFNFKDDKMAIIGLMIKQQGDMNVAMLQAMTSKSDGIESCDDTIVAMVRADAAKVAGINSSTKTAISWVGGLIGLGIISDNWGPSSYSDGAGAKTQNNYNSRVVSDSNASGGSSISSSGTGLGIGNTGSGGDAVGGFYPRSQADLVNQNGTQSNSGELNADFLLPGEMPVEIQPVQ